MFIDERDLTVRSGNGGDGVVSWKREKFVPRGGPGGGDGGRGGDVVFLADAQLTTFGDMEQDRVVRAAHGERGGKNLRAGAAGEDRVWKVPVGTTVYDATTGDRLADLTRPGERWTAARGGRGGRGNARFATATEQRPQHAELGGRGEERRLHLELRLLADVGLVGLPNAGKSTLLAAVSRATPRIAAYPFTTLEPALGIVEAGEGRRFVVADLPGLIEGAHRGRGLGDRFLRHVERTRVLLHLVDPWPPEGGDPAEAFRTVRREVEAYGAALASRPYLVAATKADLSPGGAAEERALSRLREAVDRDVHVLSARTGAGLADLVRALDEALRAAPEPPEVPASRPADGRGEDGATGAP
jgi:GTP-binding protein